MISAGSAQHKQTERHTAIVYDKSPEHIANLCEALSKYSWNALISAIDCGVIDANETFDDFYKVVHWHLEIYIPAQSVVMKAKDPAFITPNIKLLLHRRNKLRKLGRIEQADAIASKINKMIDYNRKQLLVNAECQDTAKLWSMLRRTNNWGARKSRLGVCGSADDVNNYFATVATDNNYSRVKLMDELNRQTSNNEATPVSAAAYARLHHCKAVKPTENIYRL